MQPLGGGKTPCPLAYYAPDVMLGRCK